MATIVEPHSDIITLHQVPFALYAKLSDAPENRHLKMAYHDGTLEIVSPSLHEHEEVSVKFRWIVTTVARHLRIGFRCSAGATFRKSGEGPYGGVGKEPDESYYFASAGRLPRDHDPDLDAGDPPPDLWIEVDNRASSAGRMPVYAALGVPEVWRYRSKSRTLRFYELADQSYRLVDQSQSLAGLTPSLVIEALALGVNPLDSTYLDLLEEWVAQTFPRPAAPG